MVAADAIERYAEHRMTESAPFVASRVGVVVPAHNEETLLPRCLNALGVAASAIDVRVCVVVVLDCCNDSSARAIADVEQRAFESLTILTSQARNVGIARHLGIETLIDRHGPGSLWLATTDADSMVGPQWLHRQLSHAEHGASAVVGTVEVLDWSMQPPRVARRYRARYRSESGHRHMHGANLSMTAAAYLASGGFPPLRSGEDVALISRLGTSGQAIVWAADLPVVTSARRTGRAPNGFAGHLASLAGAAPAGAALGEASLAGQTSDIKSEVAADVAN